MGLFLTSTSTEQVHNSKYKHIAISSKAAGVEEIMGAVYILTFAFKKTTLKSGHDYVITHFYNSLLSATIKKKVWAKEIILKGQRFDLNPLIRQSNQVKIIFLL